MSDIDTFEKLMKLQEFPASALKDLLSRLLKENQLPTLILDKTQLLAFLKKYAAPLNEFIISNYNSESNYRGIADYLLENICHLNFSLEEILTTVLKQSHLSLEIGSFLIHHPDILKTKLATFNEIKLIAEHIDLELEEAFINQLFNPDFLFIIKRIFKDTTTIDEAIKLFETSKYHDHFKTMIMSFAKKHIIPKLSHKNKNQYLQRQEVTISEQTQQISSQNRQIQELERSNNDAFVSNLALLNNMHTFQESMHRKDELLATRELQLSSLYSQLNLLTYELEKQKADVRTKTVEVDKLQYFVQFLEASRTRVTNEAIEKNLTEIGGKYEKLNEQYTELSAKYIENQQELSNKTLLLESKETEIANLRASFSEEKQLAIDGKNLEINALKTSLLEAEQTVQQKESKVNLLQEKNAYVMTNLQQLLKDNEQQQNVTTFFINESKKLQQLVDTSKTSATVSNEEIKSLTSKNSGLVEEVAQAQLEILYLNNELSRARRKFKPSAPPISENDTSNQLISSLQQANIEMTAHIHQLESQIKKPLRFFNTSALKNNRHLLPDSYTVPENIPTVRPKPVTALTSKTSLAKKSKVASETETDIASIKQNFRS